MSASKSPGQEPSWIITCSGIDLCMFETLKFAYARAKGTTEVGVFPLLVCGSISGSVGATAVYPLNLIRARLQSSGSSGHPQLYVGIRDAAWKTMKNEGWRGFYKGLVPTLAKVNQQSHSAGMRLCIQHEGCSSCVRILCCIREK